MSSKQHVIPADVRKQILERVKQGDKSIPEIAQEHGVDNTTIYKWLSKGATAQPTWTEFNKLKREIQALLELVGRLTWEKTVAEKKEAGI